MECILVGEVTLVTSEVLMRIHWQFQDLRIFLFDRRNIVSPTFQFGNRSLYFLMRNEVSEQNSECFLWIINENGRTFPLNNRRRLNNFNPKVEFKTNGKVIQFKESIDDDSFSFIYSHIPLSTNPSTISVELSNTPGSKKRLLELNARKQRARKRLSGLSYDLKESYLSKRHCDLTIKVKEREFQVHKLILMLRSPVFEAMMEHNMLEKKNNYIDVADCDPQVFDMFLIYMYSGEIENISFKNVSDLYAIADKYDVYQLKAACAEFIKHNLTVDVFCDVVELAEKHSDSDLLNVSRQFFNMNSKAICKKRSWKSFCQHNAAVVSNFFTAVENENLSV